MTQPRLLQHRDAQGIRRLVLADTDGAYFLSGPASVRELAMLAIAEGTSLLAAARRLRVNEALDLDAEYADNRFICAVDHSDDARIILTGTGLTHLGSAEGRDKMHRAMTDASAQTDSMRMFLEGLEGGKPAEGEQGQQPEWFYKGDGQCLIGPRDALVSPGFAKDGSEEPELAGIYLIGPDGTPFRLGLALANEFSDHVTERHNYLWLAHSKLRPAALGAELLLGDPPADIRGISRILRNGEVLWEKPFLTGEANMSHSIANLEAHHFKYKLFRRPGDIHVHVFGTATLSFADEVRTQEGDEFEISAPPFQLALRNRLESEAPASAEVKLL